MARSSCCLLLGIAITMTLTTTITTQTLMMESVNIMPRPEGENEPEPIPKEWPERFHALLVLNDTTTSEISVDNLWYDWPNGLNANLIQYQLGRCVHDIEWNNGSLFYYYLDDSKECTNDQFEVGIPRRNWMEGAVYLGQSYIDGFLCNVWNKVDFTWYFEDVLTKRPVMWWFFNGLAVHVVTFEEGAVLEKSEWQAPSYCFDKQAKRQATPLKRVGLPIPPLGFSRIRMTTRASGSG